MEHSSENSWTVKLVKLVKLRNVFSSCFAVSYENIWFCCISVEHPGFGKVTVQ